MLMGIQEYASCNTIRCNYRGADIYTVLYFADTNFQCK